MNINFRLIVSLQGYFIFFTGLLMTIPALVDWILGGNVHSLFLIFSVVFTIVGICIRFINPSSGSKVFLSAKGGLLLTLSSWVLIVSIAAVPLFLAVERVSYTDAFFEMMSGITTTGATVIYGLDSLSPGVNTWRALTQWVGGIGIIITGLVLIPFMNSGGMQFFKIEAFETFDSAFDQAKQIAKGMLTIYIIFTFIIFMLLLVVADINWFDAFIHSLTSVSTAGFSNKDASIAYFNNPAMEMILVFAMIVGGLPYVLLYYFVFLKRTYIFKDHQVLGYLKILFIFVFLLSLWLITNNGFQIWPAFRHTLFTVTSLMTGTGYVSANYELWGVLPVVMLFMIMFIGGCGGSTACGIKVYRFQVGFKAVGNVLDKLILGKHIHTISYNNKNLTEMMIIQVFAYFFLFLVIWLVSSVYISSLGFDFKTSISAVLSCLTNVGPGLGQVVGPAGNFSLIPEQGKWFLSLIMLIGRLEILGVFILLRKAFWRS